MAAILDFKEKPSLFSAYKNLFAPGRAKYAGLDELPKTEAHWKGATETPDKIQAYREACGFENDGFLPLLYPHVLTSAMHIHMLANKAFPISAFGAVHARNHILQRRKIEETETVDLVCAMGEARILKPGLEVDITTTVLVDDTPVWESISAYLFRGKKFGDIGEAVNVATFDDMDEPGINAEWHVPKDMGRRYAKITGDYNPIHVSKIMAKIFGFKRDIIHGMWALAKSVSHLPDKGDAVRLDVAFKGPVFMDSDCFLKGQESDTDCRFDLFCGKNPRPSIVASLRKIEGTDSLLS